MVTKPKEKIWEHFTRFAPLLDQLQQKGDSIADAPVDEKTKSTNYWEKVGSNLLELARKCDNNYQVWLMLSTVDTIPLHSTSGPYYIITYLYFVLIYRFVVSCNWGHRPTSKVSVSQWTLRSA